MSGQYDDILRGILGKYNKRIDLNTPTKKGQTCGSFFESADNIWQFVDPFTCLYYLGHAV